MRTVAHLSDLHFGRHDPAIVEALLESLNRLRPDLVVISGDLTQRARSSQFFAAKRFLDQINSPKLVVPGNHDIPLYNLFARIVAPFSNYRRYISVDEKSQCFADDEIAVFGLNTVRRLNWKNGRLAEQQLLEMTTWFETLAPRIWKILVTHHPIASVKDAREISTAQRSASGLTAVLKSGVHLVLSGHSHRAAHGALDAELESRGSLLVIHAGTAISTRTRGGQRNSYNLLTVEAPRLSVTIMESSVGAGFSRGPQTQYILCGSIWQPVL